MKRYMIERDIPEVGSFEREQLRDASKTSNGDKTFCVYLAEDEDAIRKHAEISGFPASKITEISSVIDPTTAN
jgi:hypothetical protein